MAIILALSEAIWIFAVLSGMFLLGTDRLSAQPAQFASVFGQAFVLALCGIAGLYYTDLYDLRVTGSFGQFASRLPRSFGVALVLAAGLSPFLTTPPLLGPAVVSGLVLMVALLLGLRALSYRLMRCWPFRERVLVLGTSVLGLRLLQEIQARPYWRYHIVGVIEEPSRPRIPGGYPVLGPLDDLSEIVAGARPDRIVVALAERRGRLPVRPLLESLTRRIVVEDAVDVYERVTGKLAIESMTPSTLIFSKHFIKPRLELMAARALSVLVAAIALAALAPLLGLIALAIKLDSRGPVFFVQDRVGLLGRRFPLFKFRTMHPEHGGSSVWARDNSDRITRVGQWLRRFRLDELPQFVNILKGDMNLVGPRPHPVSNFELFVARIPHYVLRAVIRPGMTGWAQVRYGYANNLEEETEKMRYDLYYIKRMSPWLDLRILLDTVKIIFVDRRRATAAGQPSPAEEELAA